MLRSSGERRRMSDSFILWCGFVHNILCVKHLRGETMSLDRNSQTKTYDRQP